jgi:hypothetical protein
MQGLSEWKAAGKDEPFVYRDEHNTDISMARLFLASKALPGRALAAILPEGFPNSVGPGYATYVQGQMIAAVASSAGGVLSMQAS